MFASRLKKARKDANLTLEKLSELYNSKYDGKLSKGTLSKYENRKQEPMIYVVRNLADLLGVSTDYLLGSGPDRLYDDALTDAILNLITELTPEETLKVEAFIEGLKANR